MARNFSAAASSKVTLALGAAGSLSGATSFAVIVRKTTDGTFQTMIAFGAHPTSWAFYIDNADKINLYNASSSSVTSTMNLKVADGWTCLSVSRATGTSTPRFHKFVYGTDTLTHENGSVTLGNLTPATRSVIGANSDGSSPYDGDMAIAGAWAANLADAQAASLPFALPAWFQVAPNGLWLLDQSATTQKVLDLTGNGANESGLTATTVGTVSVPVFSYGHPIVKVGRFTPATPDGCGVSLESDDYILTEDGGALAAEACVLNLSPASITVTAVALTATPEAVSVALSPATITLTAVVATSSPGIASQSLTPANITLTPVAVSGSAGTATQALTPASVAVTPVALTASPGGASQALSPPSITVTPVALTGSPGTASQALSPASITFTPVALGGSPGGTSQALTPPEIVFTPVALTASPGTASQALTAPQIVLTPVQLAGIIGDVGEPGCITLEISTPHTLAMTLTDLDKMTLTLSEPPTMTLTVADLGECTLTVADLGTMTLTIGECTPGVIPPLTGETRVTTDDEDRVTTDDETRVTA